MHEIKRAIGVFALALLSSSAAAAPAAETLRYEWRLRGALSWVARVKFPTSGTGVLQTAPRGSSVESHLRVSAGGSDYIEYQSSMDASQRTLTSANGFHFGSRSERKETVYDYSANVARIAEREEGQTETKTRELPVDHARDVLTTIAYLREHAAAITAPLTTDVYADGKPYRVLIQPAGLKTIGYAGRDVKARVFRVVAAPGAKKKFAGLTVWLSQDEQRLPLRIVIDQQYASLDLKLRAL